MGKAEPLLKMFFIFTVLLLWNNIGVEGCARKSGQSHPTVYQSELHIQLKIAQHDIRSLNHSTISETRSGKENDELITRLETQMEYIQRLIEVQQITSQRDNTTDDDINKHYNFAEQLKNIKVDIDNQKRKEDENLGPSIVDDINESNFLTAWQTFSQINNKVEIGQILLQVDKEQAFDKILNFSKSTPSREMRWLVIDFLKDEAVGSTQNEVLNLLNLASAIIDVDQVFGKDVSSSSTTINENKTLTALNEIQSLLVKESSAKFRDAILQNKFSNDKIQSFIEPIIVYSYQVYKDIARKAICEAVNRVSFDQLLAFAKSNTNMYHHMATYMAIFHCMNKNDEKIVKLAVGIKNEIGNSAYNTLEVDVRREFEGMRDKLPACVKNAIFEDTVCIKNVQFNEYLYSAGDHYKYNPAERRVFLWIKGTTVREAYWYITAPTDGSYLFIRNKYWGGEYLYFGTPGGIPEAWPVTGVPWNGKSDGKLLIEPIGDGDTCYIKNARGMYMMGSWGSHDNDGYRRYAVNGKNNRDPQAQWRIESC